MKFTRIPTNFFPTTLLLIDDNQRYLKNMSLQLDEFLSYRLFDNPEKALQYLNTQPKVQSLSSRYVTSNVEKNSYANDQYSIDVDLSSIHKAIYNKERFLNISTIIVDYAMPNLNGIEFCQRIDPKIKKIMLTGEADHQIAVQAFNESIIDKFILKSENDLNEKLSKSICEMQQKYFLELTNGFETSLLNDPSYCLKDSKVIELFNQICEKNNIVEHYLLDTLGSLFLLDNLGKPYWFIIKTNAELKMYADFCKDDKMPPHLCQQLSTGQKIPFFPDMKLRSFDWNAHLYPAEQIKGNETYYYALVKDVKNQNWFTQDVLSYQSYLDAEAASYH